MKAIHTLMVALGFFVLAAAVGASPLGFQGAGPRLGVTINPDQFHFGGHIDFGDIAPNLMLLPNLEIGVGDNVTTIAPTFEMDYRFRADWGTWTPYVGGGLGPIFYSPRYGENSTDAGLYVQAGLGRRLSTSNPSRFFMEFKLGLIDAPDAKFTVGWTFHK